MGLALEDRAAARNGRDAVRGRPEMIRTPGIGRLRSGPTIMFLSLIAIDTLTAQLAFYLGAELHATILGNREESIGFNRNLALIALTLPVAIYLMDVYRVPSQAPIERFPMRIKATCLLFALLAIWHYETLYLSWPIGAIALTFLFSLILPLIGENAVRTLMIRLGWWGVPAVVIGTGPIGCQVARIMQQMPELGLRPVGFFDDERSGDKELPATLQGLPVLGSIADSAAFSSRVETAIVTTPPNTDRPIDAIAAELGYRNVIVVPELRELPTLWVQARDLNGLIGLQLRRNLLMRRNRWLKQTIDALLALPIAVCSVPIITLLALWIRMVSKGSPFFTQVRAGKGGRPIRIWKLRTMYPDAEQRLETFLAENPSAKQEWERYFKLTDDPRILPGVGYFLRRTSLDELPQIINVLRGEMSLVGPRPFPAYHLDKFDRTFQSLRSSVTPGITGLWQVSARSDGDLPMQQALDTYYIRNWSIWIDVYILYRTLGAVISGRGAR